MTSNVRFLRENDEVRSDRLLSILMLLQSRGRVPAADLAGRLEVSVRTIYRDVEALSAAGVPVYTERGRHGGIELLPGYRTDMTGLTRDEARALFVLTAQGGAHADLGLQTALRSALAKVMTALPEPFRPEATATSQRILVDPAGWMRQPPAAGLPSDPASRAPHHLTVLQSAVFADRRLRLRYRHTGQPAARTYTLDPYGLVCKAGIWYLIADHRGRPLLLRLARVESASLTSAAVRRRLGADLAGEWERLRRQVEDKPAPVRVIAKVRREMVDMFCRVHARNLAGPPPSGGAGGPAWAEIELRFRGVFAARPLVAFGADVQVIWPPEVRADLAATGAAVAATHSAPHPTDPLPATHPAPHPTDPTDPTESAPY
jgi:predicted DNA-binding transcriptional regulator YafY